MAKKAKVFNIAFDLLTRQELINKIVHPANYKTVVGHVNTKGLNLAFQHKRFAEFYQLCDYIYCDGFGPLLGAKLMGYSSDKKYRHTCPDFLDGLLFKLQKNKKSIYFLGAKNEVIHSFKKIIDKKFPTLMYKTHHGYFKKAGDENKAVVSEINHFNPDVLFVGFGMSLQEYWILDNYKVINANVFLPEGACLDFYTNTVFRAPAFFTNNGLEWLARLITEPKRLWKRYLIGNPQFIYRVLKEKFKMRK